MIDSTNPDNCQEASIMRNRFVAVVVAAGLLSLAAAVSAEAHTTVCKLSPAENEHCYAYAQWAPGGGWVAEGSLVKIETITDYLPGWAENDFFTNEMWVD